MKEEELKKMFDDVLTNLKVNASVGSKELAKYVLERSEHLSLAAGEPGFDKAVRAEANALAIEAGLLAVSQAESTDAELRGFLYGVLRMASAAL